MENKTGMVPKVDASDVAVGITPVGQGQIDGLVHGIDEFAGARHQARHVGDLALCLRLALERPETVGQAYELGGPRTWTYREITEAVTRSVGRRRIIVPVPVPVIRLVAGTAELLRLRFFPVATDQLRQLALDNVGPLDGVYRAFGFVPRKMEGELLYLRNGKKKQEPAPAA